MADLKWKDITRTESTPWSGQLQQQQQDWQYWQQQGQEKLEDGQGQLGMYVGQFLVGKDVYNKVLEIGQKILDSFPIDLEGEIQLTKFQYYAVTAFLKDGIPDSWQGFMAFSWRDHPIVLVE